ncbi:Glycosyltransferase involved in cell wall bisynthesis [Salegentibacter holothuriorum]|uniref:Glycosyltransferase involved in cell wall bisynthesis n=1 Tax=Salegentibacter holothuriorum TaxID=241145 RepID=A0A1T5AP86_9FLAO|nr:glycosyltransferase family 4 protein [Salegentibacter holothuriorum]SKB36637.1 Glycosyltransferase involved in cell wall bisynthesis [Salegentibacter holothuriorum]
MRILFYTTSYFAKHGGSIQSIELHRHLKKFSAVEAIEIFPEKHERLAVHKKGKITFRDILRRSGLFQTLSFFRRNRFYLKGLTKKVEEFKPDVLLIRIDSNFLQISILKKKFPNLLICAQINGSPFDENYKNIAFKKYFLQLQYKAYLKTDLNIFISDFSRKNIMGLDFNPNKNIVVHNGTNVAKFFPISNKNDLRLKLGYPKGAFIFGYIGTLDHHKKMEILINSFYDLQKKHENLFLIIIGDGPAFNKIKQRINYLSLTDKTSMSGWLNHKNINAHINCFDVAVHHYANPYMNPLKIFEYLSAGLPVIAPNIPSIQNSFKTDEDLLITRANEDSLKLEMERIMNDDVLRTKLSNKQNLIKKVENNFTWDKYAERILNNLQKL